MRALERAPQDDCFLPLERDARSDDSQTRDPRQELLRSALQYVNENLESRLTWAQIAAAVGLSAFKFGRSFRLASGVTPHQYVVYCRVRRAMHLLERAELAIAEIALEVGCSCQSHLTAMFRKHTGTTPGAFRRAAQESRRELDEAATRALHDH